MAKIPDFCCSHTVKGTASIQMNGGTYTGDILIPEGVYWTDPIYGLSATPPNLGPRVGLEIDNANSSTTVVGNYENNAQIYDTYTMCDDAAVSLDFSHANTSEEGRRIAKRIGLNPIGLTADFDNGGNERFHGLTEGYWYHPSRAEASKMQEDNEDGNAGYSESWSGFGFSFRLGSPARGYLLSMRSVAEEYVWSRGHVQSGYDTSAYPYDLSFEARIWQHLARGEMVRIYTDRSATRTYTTAAMTKTSGSVTVNSATGIAIGDKVCIDGEWCYVSNVAGSTLTLLRGNPVTHPSYAPLSKDFVATYCLATDDGNVNLRTFAPERRAINQARYDMDIALRRTRWAG